MATEKVTKKFKALVHYIIQCRENPAQLGAIRLNKVLWYADVAAYQMYGKSITGSSYVKRQFGPVPKFIRKTLRELEAEGKIHIQEPKFPFGVRKFNCLEDADTSSLSSKEQDLAEAVMDEVCNHTASRISELSHDVVWNVVEMGDEIPLKATFAANKGAITEDTMAWAVKEAKGWLAQEGRQPQPA